MRFKEYNVNTPLGPIVIIPNGPSTFYVGFENLTVRNILYRGSIHLKDNGQTVDYCYIRRLDKLTSFPTLKLIKDTIVKAVADFKTNYPDASKIADYVVKYNEALTLLESIKELKESLDKTAHEYDGLRYQLLNQHPSQLVFSTEDKERLVPLA